MKLVLTSPDGGKVRFFLDECIIARASAAEHANAKAVIITGLGVNFAVMETPEEIWKMIK